MRKPIHIVVNLSIKRVLEDHFQFLKSVILHLQEQISTVSEQLTHEREAAFHNIELTKYQAAEHARFADDLRRRSEEDRISFATLATEMASLRHEMSSFRADTVGRVDESDRQVRQIERDGEDLRSVCQSLRSDLSNLSDHITKLDARLTKSLHTADENLIKCAAVLQSVAANDKAEGENERGRIWSQVQGRVSEAMECARETEAVLRDEMKAQHDHLINIIMEERTNSENSQKKYIEPLDEGLRELNAWVQNELDHEKNERVKEAEIVSRALSSLRETIVQSREEDKAWMGTVRGEVRDSEMEMKGELDRLKTELEVQIRKMTRPLIVL